MHEPMPKPERFLASKPGAGNDGPPLHGNIRPSDMPPGKEEQFGTDRLREKKILSQKGKFTGKAREVQQVPSPF